MRCHRSKATVSAIAMVLATGLSAGVGAAEALVYVPAKAGPWDTFINFTRLYGKKVNGEDNQYDPPISVSRQTGVAFLENDWISITYQDGRPYAGDGLYGVGAAGVPGYYLDCPDAPGCYTADTSYLVELIGAFADSLGNIIDAPFDIGNGRSMPIPIGARQLLLGFNDNWHRDNGDGVTVVVREACVPGIEEVQWLEWKTPTVGSFYSILTSPIDFSGTHVREVNVPGGANTCYDRQDANFYSRKNKVDGSGWEVDEGNFLCCDDVGWRLPEMIQYYRERGRAPCEIHLRQQMQIKCFGKDKYHNYGPVNELIIGLTLTDIYVEKKGIRMQKPYP